MILLADAVSLVVPGMFFVLGLRMLRTIGERQDHDVLEDLKHAHAQGSIKIDRAQEIALQKSGLSINILVAMIIATSLNLLSTAPTMSRLIGSLVIGAAIGLLFKESALRRTKERTQRGIDYFLPIVMERIVMAVESGLDVVPAIEAVISLKQDSGEDSDPVSDILAKIPRYTDAGLGFLEAIEVINQDIEAPSLKHALVHLGIAYREGGEIIHPLRELSDATQLHFQESVEEEIAKMPVKATVPLLCTFGGLIIAFLTTPLIQVMSIATKAMPK